MQIKPKVVLGCCSLVLTVFVINVVGCKEEHTLEDACVPGSMDDCPSGLICEQTIEGETGCFEPVVIRGNVFDLGTDVGIQDAVVIARDSNGAALGSVAITDASGDYELYAATVRLDEEGGFDGSVLTLRVDAEGYASYPGGFRPSLPVDLDDAILDEGEGDNPGEYTVQTPTTDVALIALTGNTSDLGSIRGTVPDGAGALVVAEDSSATVTGVADGFGSYVVFNVQAGDYTLNAYAAGRQYSALDVSVSSGEEVLDADFSSLDAPTATVTGNVNIVNAPGGSVTSVVLVVESTFSDTFKRGEVPPGLRAGEVSGAFEIADVPDGEYVVLAAFENDDLVRDPDTSIGGTQIVHIEVDGESIDLSTSFKVTEALEVDSPGAEAPELVSGTPVFTWADDSSQDAYEVVVYDAFGQLIWEDNSLGSITGQQWVTLEYAGPSLEAGLYYQWRATSIKNEVPISTTEDLRGLFYTE